MKVKSLYLLFVFSCMVYAQTPTVKTTKADLPYYSATQWMVFYGIVNPNGIECSVAFEYGTTTSYGNTAIATPGTVTGNTDVSVSLRITNPDRLIHYRLKVITAGRTYYGRDFVVMNIDPTRKIAIAPTCTDASHANYEINNNSEKIVSVDYSAGSSSNGTIIIGPIQSTEIFLPRESICSFTYNYVLFKQIVSNEQSCSEVPSPDKNVQVYGLGKVNNLNTQLFRIDNKNEYDVSVSVLCVASTYTHTVPALSSVFVVGDYDAEVSCNGATFIVVSGSPYYYEEMGWLDIVPLSKTPSTATFELYNRDDITRSFVLRNAAGIDSSYTLTVYESKTVTLTNEVWSAYATVYDRIGSYHSQGELYRSGECFGDPAYTNNGKLKVAVATPGCSLTPQMTRNMHIGPTTVAVQGTIANSAFIDAATDYHLAYGIDRNNLNLITPLRNVTVVALDTLSVSDTLRGLTESTVYYYRQVVDGDSTGVAWFTAGSPIPSDHLMLHLRADAGVTESVSGVSGWNDIFGNGNNAAESFEASQPTFVTNALNGYPVVRFNGSSSQMTLPTSVALGIQSNPYEIFIVARSNFAAGPEFLISGSLHEKFEYHLNPGARFIPCDGTYLDKTDRSFADGNAHVFAGRASAAGGTVRVDGIDGGAPVLTIALPIREI